MANAPDPASYFKHAHEAELDDEHWHMLMHQLVDFLGPLLQQVSDAVYKMTPCEPADSEQPCICPGLYAYGALYEAGFAIVPVADARMLHAVRGRVN